MLAQRHKGIARAGVGHALQLSACHRLAKWSYKTIPVTEEYSPVRARVLVVDDDPAIARAVTRILRGAASVTAESDPSAALDRVRRGERFALVICDVMMPGVTGPHFFERVIACAPEMRAAFVFASGGMTDSLRQQLAATGRPLLEKPLTAAALLGFLNMGNR